MLQILEHYEQRSGEPARLVRTVNEEIRWRGRIHDVELPPKPKPIRIITAFGKKVPEESLQQELSKKKNKAIAHSFFDQTRDRLAQERESRKREAGRYRALSAEERARERRAGERIEAMKNAREMETDRTEKARLRDKVRASLESKRYSESERRRKSGEGKRPSPDEEAGNIDAQRERYLSNSSKTRPPSSTDVGAIRRLQKERFDFDRVQRERTVLSRLQKSLPPNARNYRDESEETTVGSRDETDEESAEDYRRARQAMDQKVPFIYNDNNQQGRSHPPRSNRIKSIDKNHSPEVPTSPPFMSFRRGIDDERLPFSPNSNASSPPGVSPARSASSSYSARSLRQQQLSRNSKNNISGVAVASDTDESEDTNAVLTSSRMHRLGALRTIKEMYESVLNDRADTSTKDAIRVELESVLRELRSVEALLDKSALGVYQPPRTRANTEYEDEQYRRSDDEEVKEVEEGSNPVRTTRTEEQEETTPLFIEQQHPSPSINNNNARFRPIYDGTHSDEYVEGAAPQSAAVAEAYEQQQPEEMVGEESMVIEGQQPQSDQLMMDQMAWVFPTYNWGPFLQDYVFRILQKISGYLTEGILFNEDPEAHFKASTKLFPLEIYDELEEEFNRQLHLRRIIFDSVESMLRDMKIKGHPLPIPEYYTSELTRLVDQVFTRFISSSLEDDSAARKVLLELDGELFRGEVMDYIFRLLKLAVRQFDLDPNNPNNVMTDQDFTACEDHLATDVRNQRKAILLATDEALLDLYPGLATGFAAPMASSQSLKAIVIYGKRPPIDDLHALAKQVTARLQRCEPLHGPGLDMSVLQGQEAGDAIGRRLVAEEERFWSDLTHEMDELALDVAGEMFDVIEESVELEVVRVMDEMEKRDRERLIASNQYSHQEQDEEQI